MMMRCTEHLFSMNSKLIYGRLFAMDKIDNDILGKCKTY